MFYYGQLAKLAFLGPLNAIYVACITPFLALLRAFGKRPPPASADEDLSGRVIIVTGANAGECLWSTNRGLFASRTGTVDYAQQQCIALFCRVHSVNESF